MTDEKDFYKFELTVDGKVNFSLSKWSANVDVDVDLNLYDSSGNSLHLGWAWDDSNIIYTKTLASGIYFVEVDYRDNGIIFDFNQEKTSAYDLNLTLSDATIPTPTPDTDNTIATAQNIGVLATDGTKVLQDSVTKTTDDKDFYKFELSVNSKVSFLLSELFANVDLNLYNENGDTVQSGSAEDNSDISYAQLLAAGTYYAEVDYANYDNPQETTTTYDLSLRTSELKIPDSAGYTQINLTNAVAYLETHQNMYNDQIIL
ncbi:MAG: hypothetical protein FE834_09695, partial [Gammaproteobacteria bacterium]|nr:hypothetical protein [Gammaproteobacteria bacterium]